MTCSCGAVIVRALAGRTAVTLQHTLLD